MGETRIRAALELLREDGWVQGVGKNKAGQRCVMQALTEASGNLVFDEEHSSNGDIQTLRAIVFDQWSDRVGRAPAPIVELNDHWKTTFADVEFVMTKAAIMREEAVDE